jgi:hypothetical protein
MSMFWVAASIITTTMVSAGVSAYGSYQQGKAQKKMNDYSADVARQQAAIEARTAETNVTLVQDTAKEQSKIARREAALIEGEQKGILAAQGVGGDSVTAADILTSTFDTAELDRQAIRYNADAKAWAIKSGAEFNTWDLVNQSNMYGMAGKNAMKAGKVGVATSLLEGASSSAQTGMLAAKK